MAKIVNSEEFRSNVNEGLVVVDFFATWCGPCKMLAPVFEELSSEMDGKATFLKVDVDQCGDIAREYSISTIPTMIIFKNGEKQETMVGFLPKESIKSNIEKYL
ncbi:thioredoxin [Romboutsia lituseburensis]|uniref:Thioredoxin n=1 Tax=Romboutsia lituseburensis DSM 797 TaxID=1121325 RepID=A0A1G9TF03_9FIRM|nr:thioredoxin [Romboutsia lituseburensis]CEH36225.1 Thioredoxin [Romboutsia lituseburensis]SDM46193.1 thioredoxin [Romboutsia lituseburensis DSM 797]